MQSYLNEIQKAVRIVTNNKELLVLAYFGFIVLTKFLLTAG